MTPPASAEPAGPGEKMNYAINGLVLTTLFFAGMAQAKAMDPHTAYWIAGASGALAMVLAIVRYKQQKDAGK